MGVTKLTYRPATVSGMVENPLRGMYRWSGSESVSADIPANDRYERDRVYWGRIEPADNEFNFSWIQQGLDDARARGAKFGFRVMAYCPGCWMEYRPDTNNWPQITPAFIPTQPGTTAPDWNSETFLSQWEELMTALGDEFGDDPALGYVDVGGYGMYGEWHVRPGGASGPDGVPATTESMQRIVNAVSAAFPTKHLLINTMTSVDFTLWALNSNPLMGMRTDNLGAPNMYSMVTVDTRLQQVWKTRPFFTEWATTGDPVLASSQVSQWHTSTVGNNSTGARYLSMTSAQQTAFKDAVRKAGYRYQVTKIVYPKWVRRGSTFWPAWVWTQTGSAPTYDPWSVKMMLKNSAGVTVWSSATPINLKGLASGSLTYKPALNVTGIPAGKYRMWFSVTDPSGYSAPMNIANVGRSADGEYPLGWISVR